jgi:HK97 family phage major capsid protein
MALREILTTKLQEAQAEWDAIDAKAAEENRGHTDEETARVELLKKEWASAQSGLANLDAKEEFKQYDASSRGKPISASAAMPRGNHKQDGDGSITISKPSPSQNPSLSMGEFFQAVHQTVVTGERDPRLKILGASASTYANETTGSDGGALVPTEYSSAVEKHMLDGEFLLPFCRNIPVSGNSLTVPSDETTPWGSTGIRAYWTAEAAAGTQNKPVLRTNTLRLKKLMVLVPVTEELLQDSVALESYLTQAAGVALRWKINDAIINGNGTGMPLGIFNAACLVSQAKTSGQTADTINADNVTKMFGRIPADSIGDARWIVAPDAYNQLPQMVIGDQPIWTPPNSGIKDAPAGLLLGRPVHISPTCQTLGDLGDIYLGAFKQYLAITKGGIQGNVSMHLWFDQDLSAFKWTFRMDGQPWLSAAISTAYGSSTLSPFVGLAARA